MARFTLVSLLIGWLLVTSTSAETLYGADGAQGNPSNLRIIDPASGAVISTVGAIGFAVTGMAIHPVTGVMYGSTSRTSPASPGSLITIDKTTGKGTLVAPFVFPVSFARPATLTDLTFTRDGTLYGLGSEDANLYVVNLTTGVATKVGAEDSGLVAPFGGALAADPCDTVYVSASTASVETGILQTLDRSSGLASAGIRLLGDSFAPLSAMKFNSAGRLYAVLLDTSVTPRTASLITVDKVTGAVGVVGPTVNGLDAIAFDGVTFAPCTALVAAVLPSGRSVVVGTPATAFVTIINAGVVAASGVGVALESPFVPVDFTFQTTDPRTNAPTGKPNTPVDIGPGQAQTYVIALTPTDELDPTDVAFGFVGLNTAPVPALIGLNTLLLSASFVPVPDIVALAATLGNDGIVRIPGTGGTGVFAVATSNVGAPATITVVATTAATLPVEVTICETNPATGVCLEPPAEDVTTQIAAGETPTFGIFVKANGAVPFDPAADRVFVEFRDVQFIVRGATSVAVTTL